jgi:hypothetical protein
MPIKVRRSAARARRSGWDAKPGDAGWHIDGSYKVNGQFWANVHSRNRGLLALFLFTDVGDHDAPTEVIVGSHLDVPLVLAPHGQQGGFFPDVIAQLPASGFERPLAFATGRAGDVYLCHPFLVHRATWRLIPASRRASLPNRRSGSTSRSRCAMGRMSARSNAPSLPD